MAESTRRRFESYDARDVHSCISSACKWHRMGEGVGRVRELRGLKYEKRIASSYPVAAGGSTWLKEKLRGLCTERKGSRVSRCNKYAIQESCAASIRQLFGCAASREQCLLSDEATTGLWKTGNGREERLYARDAARHRCTCVYRERRREALFGRRRRPRHLSTLPRQVSRRYVRKSQTRAIQFAT